MLTACATTSWSSRAIRPRSSATATRAAASRSRSARAARPRRPRSARCARAARSRSASRSRTARGRERSRRSWRRHCCTTTIPAPATTITSPSVRQPGVALVAQQHCGAHAGDEDAGLVDDQLAVDEGQRRAHQPRRRRGGEREPPSAEQHQHHGGDRDEPRASGSGHSACSRSSRSAVADGGLDRERRRSGGRARASRGTPWSASPRHGKTPGALGRPPKVGLPGSEPDGERPLRTPRSRGPERCAGPCPSRLTSLAGHCPSRVTGASPVGAGW